ncbi:MAG: DsrE family protein [Balneolaceae bacterium]|nr:DsrE family protein [Balneolaceae bacterium]
MYILFLALTLIMTDLNSNQHQDELFLVLTSGDQETQMMAMVLATQSANQDVPVRILLCSEAGYLGIERTESREFKPAGRSPKDLLNGLMQRGVIVEVCGIFLPNRELSEQDLTEGITVASPPEVAEYMKGESVRYFTF